MLNCYTASAGKFHLANYQKAEIANCSNADAVNVFNHLTLKI